MDLNLNRDQLLNTHFHQFDGSHSNPNECTLCAMTSLLHMAAQQSGRQLELKPVEFGHFLDRIPFRHLRFPSWFPGPGGATHPLAALGGLKRYLRRLRNQKQALPWRPRLHYRQGPEDLARALQSGYPTMIWGVGHTGIPHAIVPIRRGDGEWTVLDPGYSAEKNPRTLSEAELGEWWTKFSIIYPRGTMLTLEPSD